MMAGYLVGALMTSITLGLVIVFSLSSSSAAKATQNTVNPSVDIGLGAICLAIAFVLYTGRYERLRQRRRERKAAKPASYLLAPEQTPERVARAKAWVSRHAHMFAIRGFAAVGALLVIKGVVGLVS